MLSIRAKILIIVLAFLALIGAAFIFYSISTTQNYKRLRLDGIQEMVAFETEKVNKIIAEIERGAIFYAIGGLLSYESKSEELSRKIALEFVNSFPLTVGGGFWFEPYAFREDRHRASFYAFYDKKLGKVRLDETLFLDDYDYHIKPWYREVADNIKKPHEVLWTRPYVDDSGAFSLMTTASCGVFNKDGDLVALSTADWEIEEVVKQLIAIKPTKNSFVLLCVPEKDYIIYCTYIQSGIGASLTDVPWDINSSSFTLDGVTYMNFGRKMGNGWLLSVQIPEKEIFSVVRRDNLRFSLIFALSSAAMLILASFSVSRFINGPITKLTEEVSSLALGSLDTKIDISSNDELGLLAQAFNKMTGDLKESIEENTRVFAEKHRIDAELNVAAHIQASMLPSVFPPFPDRKEFDIYASMVPAKEVGGDFYNFYFIDKNNLMLVIADVSGKGIPAALFMVVTKTLIENCSACKTPKAVLQTVNKKLCEGNEMAMFVTAFLAFYNIPSGKFIYVNAAHNPPLLKRKNASFEFLKNKPCLVMGFLEDADFTEHEIYLEKGDTIFLYTDGITEAMNGNNELFGEERLLSAVNNCDCSSPVELLHSVKREVDNYTGKGEQADDITMLAFKINEKPQNQDGELMDLSDIKELKIEALAENLGRVIAFVNEALSSVDYPGDLQNEIDIAVEEIFINIASYAYEGVCGSVSIFISVKDRIFIRFEDEGKPFNPLEQPDPALESPPESREIGGLGIFFIKKIMDEVEYTRKDGKNILEISKALP